MNNIINIIEESKKIISPSWPLQSFVAVNPFWNLREENFNKILSKLSNVYGQSLFLPLSNFVEKYNKGTIKDNNIHAAMNVVKELGVVFDNNISLFIRESIEAEEHFLSYKTYSEFLDDVEKSDTNNQIIEEVSKYCSSYFDLGQAVFSLKNASKRLYLEWRDFILLDKSFDLFGYKKKNNDLDIIHDDPIKLIEQCSLFLGIETEADLKLYMMKVCHHVMGWCSHVNFQIWQENLKLQNKNRGTKIEDIIAIFMFYECLLKDVKKELNPRWSLFYKQQKNLFAVNHMEWDHNFKLLIVWQRAFEFAYQTDIANKIMRQGFQQENNKVEKKIQMVFCIDVRSEIIRRKLEDNCPQVSTHGFAGFFGVSLNCHNETHNENTYHCPVLLQPKINIKEKFAKEIKNKIEGKNYLTRFLNRIKKGLISSFIYVEFFGILSGLKIILKTNVCKSGSRKLLKQKFFKTSQLKESLNDEEKLETATFVLRHLGLKQFANIVILCGHGSLTTNNAFASALECGACGGHSGNLNARFLCQLLNDEKVRQDIEKIGVFKIPKETQFIPAIHETVSDEILFLDPQSHSYETNLLINQCKRDFNNASAEAQKERNSIFGNSTPTACQRSTNWAEVRPDWALVKNACFIVAPRERTKNINLEGRAFLHDYDYKKDEGMKTLELIMTAPMVVTNWINMQYYASSVCPKSYGAGNKVLHNIEGLFGVLEGNSGDLRIGLPLQSVHDGTNLIHEPLRLSVFIEAPETDIDNIIENHRDVKNLVENQWLHIFSIDRINNKVYSRLEKGRYEYLN